MALNDWQSAAALAGLKRAFARDVPVGYEDSPAWTADLTGVADQDLMRLYRQRQQDRIDAENRARMAERAQTGLWSPNVQQSFNMGGFYEGSQYGDAARGIEGGAVTGKPLQAKTTMPMSALSNSLSSIQALRRLARQKELQQQDASVGVKSKGGYL